MTHTETFDCEANAGYVELHPRHEITRSRQTGSLVLDYDSDGRLVGYELLRAPRDVTRWTQ